MTWVEHEKAGQHQGTLLEMSLQAGPMTGLFQLYQGLTWGRADQAWRRRTSVLAEAPAEEWCVEPPQEERSVRHDVSVRVVAAAASDRVRVEADISCRSCMALKVQFHGLPCNADRTEKNDGSCHISCRCIRFDALAQEILMNFWEHTPVSIPTLLACTGMAKKPPGLVGNRDTEPDLTGRQPFVLSDKLFALGKLVCCGHIVESETLTGWETRCGSILNCRIGGTTGSGSISAFYKMQMHVYSASAASLEIVNGPER